MLVAWVSVLNPDECAVLEALEDEWMDKRGRQELLEFKALCTPMSE